MSIEGFKKVTFGTPLGSGTGVALLSDGKLHGGDSMMAYVGKYRVDGSRLIAEVRAFQHSDVPGMASVFGVPSATISIEGGVSGDTVTGTGTSPQAPGITLQVKLEPLK